ncbi:MAG TPA: hypothetical protein PLF26_12445 [Blastocatellia bacterium]|nr:hypothetical protein [Blastocatellia bacterium]
MRKIHRRQPAGSAPTRAVTALLCLVVATSTGCRRSVGPKTMVPDRREYSVSLSDSWKEQTLLNIVKLRYLDPPIFVDVGNIVASYSLETNASVEATFPTDKAFTLGAGGTFSNNPTITYTPLTGSKFIQSLMTPLPPESIFFAIQSGLAADAILFATVSSVNGVKNDSATLTSASTADPAFHQLRALIRRIQLSGAVRFDVTRRADNTPASVMAFRTSDVSEQTLKDIAEVRRLLKLDPDATEFTIVFGAVSTNGREIALQTRSILGVMATMASQVEVSPDDVRNTRATPGCQRGMVDTGAPRLIRVHSSGTKPAGAFVAVRYRNDWFYIDDGDLPSKQVFSLMMMLFTLADTNPRENLPQVTIPAR